MKKGMGFREPWFKDGLRFECNKCGDCCGGEPGVVWVKEEEIIAISDYLKMQVDEFGKKFVKKVAKRYSLLELRNGDCVMFENGCKIYSVRPYQCKSFPFWLQNLETEDEWGALKEECPGIDKGTLYSHKDIKEIVSNC